jgi:hypothetical protein
MLSNPTFEVRKATLNDAKAIFQLATSKETLIAPYGNRDYPNLDQVVQELYCI